MKKLLSLLTALLMTTTLSAQEKDVTKFLGIPVDGYKNEMIQKLKAKGFASTPENKDVLEGEFNGTDVFVFVVTNNNKVYRIMLGDQNSMDETQIKIRFNSLCHQFQNNPKYISLKENQTLSDDEEIGYGIRLHKKQYEACFYQRGKTYSDNESEEENQTEQYISFFNRSVWFMIKEDSYGKYSIRMFYDNKCNEANGEDL